MGIWASLALLVGIMAITFFGLREYNKARFPQQLPSKARKARGTERQIGGRIKNALNRVNTRETFSITFEHLSWGLGYHLVVRPADRRDRTLEIWVNLHSEANAQITMLWNPGGKRHYSIAEEDLATTTATAYYKNII